jgi:hypothetical protein
MRYSAHYVQVRLIEAPGHAIVADSQASADASPTVGPLEVNGYEQGATNYENARHTNSASAQAAASSAVPSSVPSHFFPQTPVSPKMERNSPARRAKGSANGEWIRFASGAFLSSEAARVVHNARRTGA